MIPGARWIEVYLLALNARDAYHLNSSVHAKDSYNYACMYPSVQNPQQEQKQPVPIPLSIVQKYMPNMIFLLQLQQL